MAILRSLAMDMAMGPSRGDRLVWEWNRPLYLEMSRFAAVQQGGAGHSAAGRVPTRRWPGNSDAADLERGVLGVHRLAHALADLGRFGLGHAPADHDGTTHALR